MRVIVAGGRDFMDCAIVAEAIESSGFEPTVIVSGRAKGVDQCGEKYAAKHGLKVHAYPPDWSKHGNAAGPIRNAQMADNADALVAVWDNRSPGTKSMIGLAKRKGLKVYIRIV